MDNRIATELKSRGRRAIALSELGLHRSLDDSLLPSLVRLRPSASDFVLVTSDDNMPVDHGLLIAELGITVATIDPAYASGYTEDSWGRDTVHRWAHVMAVQQPASVRRYTIGGHRAWVFRRARRRPVRRPPLG
jgi:hypothetical protein